MLNEQGASVAGQVWHITQRCHEHAFLLDLETERRRWLYWLYQARRHFDISVLNYVVTSNHVHILAQENTNHALSDCMQMINARTTTEFNRHRGRRGAFWAPEFQATAIQTNEHLARCMTYIDTNMVRAGVVAHPKGWRCGGYHESRHPRSQGGRIHHANLRKLLGFNTDRALQVARDGWIDNKLQQSTLTREPYWSNSIAVGDLSFALKMKRAMAFTHPGRRAQRERGCFAVR